MKRILRNLALLLIVFCQLLSCSEGFLEERPMTFYSENNFYDTPSGMDLAMVALYSNFYEYLIYNGREDFYESWVIGTDVADLAPVNTRAVSLRTAYYNSDFNAINCQNIWKMSYKALNPTNVILDNIEVPSWESDNQKNRIKGNALFFRAFWHFYLVQAYGDIPLVIKPVKEGKTDFIRNAKSDVLAQIVVDLSEAVKILPEIGERQGEIGKGAAQHLLTNVYLYMKDWENAELTATSLISSGTYRLMTERFGVNKDQAGTPFTDLFLEGNINRWEGNHEMIFAFQAADMYQTEGISHYLKCCWLNNYDALPGLKRSMEYWQRGKYYYRPSEYFLNLFHPNDDRGSEFAIKTIWQYNDEGEINKQKNNGTPLTQIVNGVTVEVKVGDTIIITENNKNVLWPLLTKHLDKLGTNISETNSDKDVPFMRLAETYLFRAEARFQKGNLKGAADDINMLRRRANAPEVSESEIDIDLILDERARELMGEVNRRFTLIRTGKLIERNLLHNPKSAGNISEKHNLWPIPQVEIDRMKDSPNFKQNPGY